jgi:hypothetical protein
VAVIADEPGIVVVLLDIIRNDIVVVFARPRDARSEFGQGYVWVSPDPAIGDQAVIPVVSPDEFVIEERIGGGDRKEVADPGIIIDTEGAVIPIEDLEGAAATGEVVFPRFLGEEHPNPAIGIHSEHGDVPVRFGLEVHPGLFPASIGLFLAVRPETYPLLFGGANPAGDAAKFDGSGAGCRAGTW